MPATTADAYRLLHEGAVALAQVSHHGIAVDVPYLDAALADLGGKIAAAEGRLRSGKVWRLWRRRFGDKANLGSRSQLAAVLYEDLGLPVLVRTERGQPAADEEALAKTGHPFARRYLQAEKWKKARSTFLGGLRGQVVGGRFHPQFNLHSARTFRSSSGADKDDDRAGKDFNFQNIPIRNPELGPLIRRCFVPRKGRLLLEVDYSQLEVRIAACYNRDPNLVAYVSDETKCMHRDSACELFLLRPEQVDKRTTRDWAKNRWVFPQFYGSVYFQCAPHIWEAVLDENNKLPGTETSVKEHLAGKGVTELGDCDPKAPARPGTFVALCKQAEDQMWGERFKVYARWKRDWFDAYRRTGRFTTHTGFTVEGVYRRNEVINAPVQGSAFHCLLWSLTKVHRWLRKHKMASLVVGQIHDSMLLDVTEGELEDVMHCCKEVMTVLLPKAWDWVTVPLKIEADVAATSWADKQPVKGF